LYLKIINVKNIKKSEVVCRENKNRIKFINGEGQSQYREI